MNPQKYILYLKCQSFSVCLMDNILPLLVMNILEEEWHQLVSLLLLVLYEPGCCSLAKELHEAPLHHDPEHPGQVEQDGQKQEVQRHPLVIGVVHNGGGVHVLIQIQSATSQYPQTQFTWSPPEHAPLYSLKTQIVHRFIQCKAKCFHLGMFHVEYIQQYDSSTSFSIPSLAYVRIKIRGD